MSVHNLTFEYYSNMLPDLLNSVLTLGERVFAAMIPSVSTVY